ncbi:DMT family transporter [Kitasatospora acidiphila]|uniref:DMT family transporter n=1 Tax=Kitasatospora acidiphila TaxID=2567942 RepID=A0A540VY61_9ACTN|nr:DMT family transporter [Kitasatospora acidiphila]TQF01685.1 DMT family transporter [Kitasatospora acidiphila]
MRENQSRAGLIDVLLLLVAAVWGSTYLAVKELVTPATVVAVLALRFVVTAAAMLPLALRRLRGAGRGEIVTGALLGLILAVIFAFETFGVAHTTATNAGLIISLTIVMTPLLESSVSRSWLPARFFLAAVMAVVGVGLLASRSGLHAPTLGDWLILAAAAIRAVHVTVMHRRSAGKAYDSLSLTFIQLTTAAVLFCLAGPLVRGSAVSLATLVSRLGPVQWADLLYLALICTVFAFVVQTWAVRTTSPSRVSLLLGTEPVWALLVGVLLGGDHLGLYGAIGAVLIVVGAGWGQRIERRHREGRQGQPPVVSEAPEDQAAAQPA